jgi:hypothetical protein
MEPSGAAQWERASYARKIPLVNRLRIANKLTEAVCGLSANNISVECTLAKTPL